MMVLGPAVPLPTEVSVAAGTLVTSLARLAEAVAWPDPADAGPPRVLITTNATTMASTTTTLPPASSSCLRRSARRAAACCAAILSLALCRRFRSALPILALPYRYGFSWVDNVACSRFVRAGSPGPHRMPWNRPPGIPPDYAAVFHVMGRCVTATPLSMQALLPERQLKAAWPHAQRRATPRGARCLAALSAGLPPGARCLAALSAGLPPGARCLAALSAGLPPRRPLPGRTQRRATPGALCSRGPCPEFLLSAISTGYVSGHDCPHQEKRPAIWRAACYRMHRARRRGMRRLVRHVRRQQLAVGVQREHGDSGRPGQRRLRRLARVP